MTTWSIQYGDEAGNQHTRTTDDIGEVHATLEVIVNDTERTAGYAGQTATWRGYTPRNEDTQEGVGNWTLDIVNLDTHTPDGYTLEEAAEMQAEFYGADLEDDSDPLECGTTSFTLEASERTWDTDVNCKCGEHLVPVSPSTTERAAVLMSMLYGLTSVSNARPNMHIEWSGGSDDPVIIRQTDGWTMTLDMWSVHLFPNKSEVVVNHDGEELTFQPMDALVHLGHIICKY